MPKLFKILTLGCKVNQYESAYLDEAFTDAGWRRAMDGETADIFIVNTCIVTQTASRQSRQEIRKAVRGNFEGIVVATGCYAQVFPDELSKIDGLGFIVGNANKSKLPELILNAAKPDKLKVVSNVFEPDTPFDFLPIKSFSERARAFLKIQDGCESFCSYCIVPLARGPFRSLAPQKVLSTVRSLAEEGFKEIVLTGIHLGKYGVGLEQGMNLNSLLEAIWKENLTVRIRLSSLEINEIDTGLIEMMAAENRLCRHFHIPLQSGDGRVLKRMKRRYSVRRFARLIETIHDKVPLAAIGIDIMSGFPGEDSVAHQNTYSLIKDLPVSYLHVFPFSPRPGTPAATFDGQVEPKTRKKRAAELRDLGGRKMSVFYRSCLGKEFIVLPEGWHSRDGGIMKGRTDNYLPVLFPSKEDSYKPVPVFIENVENNKVRGVVKSD